MGPRFVAEVPEIEIDDGLVHVRHSDGRDFYWRPSTFRAFMEFGQREMDAFDEATRILPFKLDY